MRCGSAELKKRGQDRHPEKMAKWQKGKDGLVEVTPFMLKKSDSQATALERFLDFFVSKG